MRTHRDKAVKRLKAKLKAAEGGLKTWENLYNLLEEICKHHIKKLKCGYSREKVEEMIKDIEEIYGGDEG